MPAILQSLLPFVPPHLARTLIVDPEWEQHTDYDIIPGALLFADISGFTPLTERLGESGKEGPEELTRLLNEYFNHLIDTLLAESGEVVKFSGDALMALFSCDEQNMAEAVRRAWQAGNAIQKMIGELGPIKTSVGELKLEMKIGIGCGDLLTMEVGGLLGRWEYVIAGDPVEQAAVAEGQASPGDVVLSAQAEEVMHPDELSRHSIETMATPIMDNLDRIERAFRRFVPGAVLGWLETGGTNWMGVLRPMTVLFIGLENFDFKADNAQTTFNDLVQNVQRTLYRFEGSLNKVAVDDKGTVIMALFGAPPLAHVDDASRGVKAAIEIREMAAKLDHPMAVGVTTGQVFAGPVGSEKRFEYTVMGDSVNIAARLMKAAGPGNILCDLATSKGVADSIRMRELKPIELKGKAEEVTVFQPNDDSLTSKIVSGSFRPPPMMLGRSEETEQIADILSGLRLGEGGVLIVEGGAGMGKTRLLKEVEMQAKIQGVPCLKGSGRGTDKQTQFLGWHEIFEQFFQLDRRTGPRERLAKVKAVLEDLAPGTVKQLPLLRDWLNLGEPGTSQEMSAFDPDTHDYSMLQLLASLIRAWLENRPLAILMDTSQYLDEWSWKLVSSLAETLGESPRPLMLALAARPMDRESNQSRVFERLKAMTVARVCQLAPLTRDEITAMIADRLQLAADRVPVRLAQFIFQRSEGTPFVAEELLRAMRDQGMIEVWKDAKSNRNHCRLRGQLTGQTESLPGAVRGLILARIDRLSANQQMTLKLASVFGRRLSFKALADILRSEQGFEPEQVQRHLDCFVDMDLLELESSEPDLIYRFRHRVTQEVAYDSMLFSHRRRLHEAAAQWFERRFGGDSMDTGEIATLCPETSALTPYLGDLAKHYQAAGASDRELMYTMLAGRRSAMLYQNEEALRFFTRALELLPEDSWRDRFEVLKDRESVYRLKSSRAERKADLQAMQVCARELDDNAFKGEVSILQAKYQYNYGRARSAERLARSAIELAEAASSKSIEASARRWLGASLQALGRHQEAREQMVRAQQMAHELNDTRLETGITAELARFAEKRGEFTNCFKFCEEALELARAGGDLANEARILRRMASAGLGRGQFDEARKLAIEAETIQRQIGDRRQESVTLDLQGRVDMATGDHASAKAFFERSLGLRQQIRDRTGQNRSLMLLGDACQNLGAFEKARLCYEQALDDAEQMGLAYGRAEVNARLVLLEHSVGDNEKAKQHGLEAARTLSQLNDLPLLAATLTQLGHALTELGEYGSAAAAYGNAIRIRSHLDQRSLLMETVAGQAQLDFKLARIDLALEKVNEVYAHFGEQPIKGIQQPFRVYQTCFEVLDHVQDPRAVPLIERAHAQVQESARAISDPLLQDSFLQGVMEIRAVEYYYNGVKRVAQKGAQ
jgi:class 3 adenylate cyclase/predicted ATPase